MTQQYDRYTPQDQEVWQVLFDRQAMVLPGQATPEFLQGVERVGFTRAAIPDFAAVNARLATQTGWHLYAVPGIVDDRAFFELLAELKFPATTWIRTPEQLDYLEEPDMFHDVYGHVPLLSDPNFSSFLQGLATVCLRYVHHPLLLEMIARLYWFTVEFGLIQTERGLRIYGAGILSSVAETAYSLGNVPTRLPFDPQRVMATSFHKDRMQDTYFVIQDFAQLHASLPQIDRVLGNVQQVLLEEAAAAGPDATPPHDLARLDTLVPACA